MMNTETIREILVAEAGVLAQNRVLDAAEKNRRHSASVLLISIVGMALASVAWPLWAFLIIVAGLTMITAIHQRSEAKQALEALYTKLASLKAGQHE
jgi:hypothetical protein